MSITAGTLYRDTMNFTRNQLIGLLLLSLLTAVITVMLNQVLIPAPEQLQLLSNVSGDLSSTGQLGLHDLIQQMTPEQQMVLLKVSAASTFAALVGNALLTGGVLTLVRQVSAGQPTSALRAIGGSAPLLPRLFFLILVCTILVQLGMLLLIVPGVLLAIAVSVSPVIAAVENKVVFASIRLSAKLAYSNLKLVAPAVLFWLLAKVALLMLVARLPLASPTTMAILMNGVSNLISAIFLIYLFRLYMLLRQ
ncbi:YciC family protein [Candidatus Symbiopectobacterium sp.]|uniref:YciC family protein n=1 Tax=Candidatus Symbiopectobacterium sp. TaxID=2816440 RepID=UPI0025BE2062|nr:YciC family protein [Candidatus Symbiopectobacterium sp.]